ncbi:MAG TPA: maltotransferase domain-containing protein [Gammaproteobacteria bacterium]|nr:maltotransferase domain-containing protein [Gammaproteobacteria bacterium]
MKMSNMPGPRVFYLCARLAGPIAAWGEWLARARSLGCDWLWIGELQPRAADTHPLAAIEPGGMAPELAGAGGPAKALKEFLAAARASGMRTATDFAPAFVARASRLVRTHPHWFVREPNGEPAIPAGVGRAELAASLVACDFAGEAQTELRQFWARVTRSILQRGFDALVCRAAHRVSAASWNAILANERAGGASFWAETLGAPIEASEALAPANFDGFFSSACWWDFRSGWFLAQEARLRRMAPTIAFPEEPGGRRLIADIADSERAEARARFAYRYAAAVAWGVILPMGYAQGWRRPLGEAGAAEPALFDLKAEITALHKARSRSQALSAPGRLELLCAPEAPVVSLASRAADPEASSPVLIALNPDCALAAATDVGPLVSRLDLTAALARELTPGRSPERLEPGKTLSLEPETVRWFELAEPDLTNAAAEITLPASFPPPVAIENVAPTAGAGRFAVKRVLGETVEVSADLVAEGHARPAAALRYRLRGASEWSESPLEFFDNDRWRGRFTPDRIGRWEFQILCWRDRFANWREDTIKRRDAGQSLASELGEGEAMLAEATAAAGGRLKAQLVEIENLRKTNEGDADSRAGLLLAESSAEAIARALPRSEPGASAIFPVLVERGRARNGAWYECFPRSLGANGRHGNFDDLIAHLPYVAGLGFDVLYLPPIHPIGLAHRKGRNNALEAAPDDPGSPWAIGGEGGGHEAIHPQLGTLGDFRRLLAAARGEGLEIALDFAIQCSRDHPWIGEHPEWFRWRPDGSIRYAENPPKKYQDIVNLDFDGPGRETLWRALADVLLFWCETGVRIFRVDNPHTKPLPFWEWLFEEVRSRYPDTVFLAEAFTRPKLMYRLAKLGFSQSYTYFTWRETKADLTAYLEELAGDPVVEFFRPNFWVNTPDINPFYLHDGVRAGFVIRAVLAATLAPSWGMYSGYELCEHEPLCNPDGSEREEYLDSEKYELRPRDFDAPGNIRAEIATLNRIRRENPAFDELTNLRFHPVTNERMMFYSKTSPDNTIWVIVSLDAHGAQEGEIELPLEIPGRGDEETVAVADLFHGGERWKWQGRRQWLRLTPERPAMILRVTRG